MPHVEKHAPGSFCWIELGTTDQNAAKQFYTSLFGWAVNDFPMGPAEFYSMFQLDGRDVAAAYTLKPDMPAPPHWMIYIASESADNTADRAVKAGANVIAPPFDVMDVGRMSVIQDPTGAVFAVWQPKSHRGIGVKGDPGSLCWADLNTADPERAGKFYSDVFGWKLEPGESGYLHIRNGEEFIGGIPPSGPPNPQAPPLAGVLRRVQLRGIHRKGRTTRRRILPASHEDGKYWNLRRAKGPARRGIRPFHCTLTSVTAFSAWPPASLAVKV